MDAQSPFKIELLRIDGMGSLGSGTLRESDKNPLKIPLVKSQASIKDNQISVVSFITMLGRLVHFIKKVKKKMATSNYINLNKLQIELLNDKAFSPEANDNFQVKRHEKKKVSTL